MLQYIRKESTLQTILEIIKCAANAFQEHKSPLFDLGDHKYVWSPHLLTINEPMSGIRHLGSRSTHHHAEAV